MSRINSWSSQSTNPVVKNALKRIQRAFPSSKKVDIATRSAPDGSYETKIEVLAPKKVMFASKTEDNPTLSVEKASEAIIRQVHKAKAKLKKHRIQAPSARKWGENGGF